MSAGARASTDGELVSSGGTPGVVQLMGRLTVDEFARLVDLSVEEVVARVINRCAVRSRDESLVIAPRQGLSEWPPEPRLGEVVVRGSLCEIKEIVDRWLLGFVLEAHDGNITHAARRLGISRRRLRKRWAEIRGNDPSAGSRGGTAMSRGGVHAPSMAKILAEGGGHAEVHEAVVRWVVGLSLAEHEGNVSRVALALGISRRVVRGWRDQAGCCSGPDAPVCTAIGSRTA